jgi:hypothetical protein
VSISFKNSKINLLVDNDLDVLNAKKYYSIDTYEYLYKYFIWIILMRVEGIFAARSNARAQSYERINLQKEKNLFAVISSNTLTDLYEIHGNHDLIYYFIYVNQSSA